MTKIKTIIISSLFLLIGGCASYEQFKFMAEEYEVPSKVFKADYAQAWQAVLQVMQTYDLEMQNQEAGVIKTRWIDNTLSVNFSDSFGNKDAVKAAKFKLIVNVVKGFKGTREVSKITVFRRQMIERDFLQGWKIIPTDGIMEKTVLYRINRSIEVDNKLKEIENRKAKEAEASF